MMSVLRFVELVNWMSQRFRLSAREKEQCVWPWILLCGKRWPIYLGYVAWRKTWADVTNLHLEQYGHDEHIDHRSHADRGLTEQPIIHKGVVARALEKKGIVSDRCELNRQIKAGNALLRELKTTVKKLMQAVKVSVPALAEAMESLRAKK